MQDADRREDCDEVDEPADDKVEEAAYVHRGSFDLLAGRCLPECVVDTEPVEDFGNDPPEDAPEDPADNEDNDCCNEIRQK
ncbi:hypothetical protein [Methanoculleus chikugoensis]|uniref:hypothetical protein n=1 Tax=Methanoculleus chikugoensis TaxID=118126 RepID=UPI001FB1EFEF|nr:hypothetical protein [Methanoculleus chikugoensis]